MRERVYQDAGHFSPATSDDEASRRKPRWQFPDRPPQYRNHSCQNRVLAFFRFANARPPHRRPIA